MVDFAAQAVAWAKNSCYLVFVCLWRADGLSARYFLRFWAFSIASLIFLFRASGDPDAPHAQKSIALAVWWPVVVFPSAELAFCRKCQPVFLPARVL